MDQITLDAVQAYYRLTQTLKAAIEDPQRSEQALSRAAWEANRAFDAAGLLGRPEHEIAALVRQVYPDFR
ncbi:hypothetical protein ACH427_32265 [Streptomyces sp. NPDC020379]|uniref:hypothetical protein n=1 Tax=Streptomyces sp. NPDC020379 TaxID=3365071 RepID=UPI0037B02F6C